MKAETIWLSPEVNGGDQIWGGGDGVGGYAPLAVATGTAGTLYWVHGNHFGVPIVTTDVAGNLAAPTGYTPVGFPGQTRTLADLYYNQYRDYDPTTGRYVQADPMGLRGGSNLYSYASGNPLAYADPKGLFPLPVITGAIGLLAGLGGNLYAQYEQGGGSFRCFSWSSLFVAGGVGAVAGALAPWAATNYLRSAALGAASNLTQYGLSQYINGKPVTLQGVIVAGEGGLIGGVIGGSIRTPTLLTDTSGEFIKVALAKSINNEDFVKANVTISTVLRSFLGSATSSYDPYAPPCGC